MQEISLRESLLMYAQRFPEGHTLRDIALRTLVELERENPFGKNKVISRDKHYTIVNELTGAGYASISDACYSLGARGSKARNELRKVLGKYNLRLVG